MKTTKKQSPAALSAITNNPPGRGGGGGFAKNNLGGKNPQNNTKTPFNNNKLAQPTSLKSAGRGIVVPKSFEVSSSIKQEVKSLQIELDSHENKWYDLQIELEKEKKKIV